MNMDLTVIFQLVVFIFSVMVHEIAHGAVALRLGDTTAKDAGRLTLNPIRHIDLFGSILLPLLLLLGGSPFLIGWAKPVPYNPMNLRDPKRGAGLIGAAGPLSNFVLAIAVAILYRILAVAGLLQGNALGELLAIVVAVNLVLGVFNLVPIPPLDGSNVLFAFLPARWYQIQVFLARYGMFILVLLIFTHALDFIQPIVAGLFNLLMGPMPGMS